MLLSDGVHPCSGGRVYFFFETESIWPSTPLPLFLHPLLVWTERQLSCSLFPRDIPPQNEIPTIWLATFVDPEHRFIAQSKISNSVDRFL